jgi:hypothetical protein
MEFNGGYQNNGNNFNQENHYHFHFYLQDGTPLQVGNPIAQQPPPESVAASEAVKKKKTFFKRILVPFFWVLSKLKWLILLITSSSG